MEFPRRKQIRCPYIDYSQTGVYFITFSVSERRNYFWENPNEKYDTPDDIRLNADGKIVLETIQAIPEHYPYTIPDYFVIMPDHVIRNDNDYLECVRYIQNNPIKWYYKYHVCDLFFGETQDQTV